MTAVEKIIAEIDNELEALSKIGGLEIMGRKIGLAFAKRVAEQAKAMEKEQRKTEREEAYSNGYANGHKDAFTQ